MTPADEPAPAPAADVEITGGLCQVGMHADCPRYWPRLQVSSGAMRSRRLSLVCTCWCHRERDLAQQ